MALTEIEYGALASSEVMNNNFNYLDNRINSVSENLISNNAGLNSNIASISSTLTSFTEKVNTDVEKINENLDKAFGYFEESGCYITTYKNNTSWYREYFSDSEKTKRVWLEQGGVCSPNATVTFVKPFTNTDYIVTTTLHSSFGGDSDAAYCPFVYIPLKKNESFKFNECGRNSFNRYGICWSAVGK